MWVSRSSGSYRRGKRKCKAVRAAPCQTICRAAKAEASVLAGMQDSCQHCMYCRGTGGTETQAPERGLKCILMQGKGHRTMALFPKRHRTLAVKPSCTLHSEQRRSGAGLSMRTRMVALHITGEGLASAPSGSMTAASMYHGDGACAGSSSQQQRRVESMMQRARCRAWSTEGCSLDPSHTMG